ncbi:hypothetical protein MNJPNG_18730 [Cupriavidus oxalaticus]
MADRRTPEASKIPDVAGSLGKMLKRTQFFGATLLPILCRTTRPYGNSPSVPTSSTDADAVR